jgi:hypothetical protein
LNSGRIWHHHFGAKKPIKKISGDEREKVWKMRRFTDDYGGDMISMLGGFITELICFSIADTGLTGAA